MLTEVKGYYQQGKVTLLEDAPVHSKSEVKVIFETEDAPAPKKRIPGSLKGKIWISDDFNEPLDDLKDYM
jgi:hypothetical protein